MDGLRLVTDKLFVLGLCGGVREREGSWNVVLLFAGERFCGSDCGTYDSNISERSSVEYVWFASSAIEI